MSSRGPKPPPADWIDKYGPALETAGKQFAEEFAARAEAMMNAIGDPVALAEANEEWNKFAKIREKEIMEVVTKIVIREAVTKPIAEWLADEMKLPQLKPTASKPLTAADLFPSLKAQSN